MDCRCTRVAAVAALAWLVGCVPGPRPDQVPVTSDDPFVDELFFGDGLHSPEPLPPAGPELIYGFMDEGTIELADALLDDCWQPAPYDMVCFDGLPTWTEDPFDEKYWRFVVYALRPLRHLVFARLITLDPVYSDKIVDILESFIDSGVQAGPFWDKHTAAFRNLVLVNLHGKLTRWNALPPELDEELEAVLHEGTAFLAEPDNFESSFNHGYNEAVALLAAAEAFPDWPESSDWRQTARSRLVFLMGNIVDPDGVEREQSPYYHLYVMTKAWELHEWADRFDIPLPDEIDDQVPGMVRYATLIADPGLDVPMIGSSALGNLTTYSPRVFDRIAAAHPEFAYVRSGGLQGTEPRERFVLFPDSGQRIMRTGFGPAETFAAQTHLFFDVGQVRSGHAHLDALQVRLYAGGRTVLPDAGLYTYEAGPEHDHFWGTSAHNTVVVDGLDQAEGSAVPVLAEEGPGWQYQSGRHELYPGVRHARGVALLATDVVLVVDRLESATQHEYDQVWHLPPGLPPDPVTEDTTFRDAEGSPLLRVLQADATDLEVTTATGSISPIQGWISYSYEERQRAPVLQYRAKGDDVWFGTLLLAGAPASAHAGIRLTHGGPDGGVSGLASVVVTVGERSWSIEFDGLGTEAETLLVTDGLDR